MSDCFSSPRCDRRSAGVGRIVGFPSAMWLLWCALCVSAVSADVRLPKIFGDSMVLQQQTAIPVWGWADQGEQVRVRVAERLATATADADGRWMVRLESIPAGGPYTMEVAAGNQITFQDVHVGEVWVCSGQSNMQWSVAQVQNAEQEIAAADHPQIRMFMLSRATADEPKDDCQGDWRVCRPATVSDFSAVGYFFARELQQQLNVPVGMINTCWGGTLCEAWTSLEALQQDPDFQPILDRRTANMEKDKQTPHVASRLYNAMIAPIVPYGIRGAIWYQGESNVRRAFQYRSLFPTMIRDWRAAWGQGDFPFLYVQLAPFRYNGQDQRNCAELWEAQLQTLDVPHTGMAVTMDIGNVRDIHPKNKQEVGRRLALWALSGTYAKDVVASGPLYKSMRVDGDQIRIAFDDVDGGLASRDGQPLSEFTIAGEDRQFVPATAKIDGDEVVVRSEAVRAPVAVRFAWYDAAQPNLMNAAGLPASPFRTDDWPAATADAR